MMANPNFKDKDYDLNSVIYYATQGAEICGQYASNAEKHGDQDAAQFVNQDSIAEPKADSAKKRSAKRTAIAAANQC
jgi:hypothetical protein